MGIQAGSDREQQRCERCQHSIHLFEQCTHCSERVHDSDERRNWSRREWIAMVGAIVYGLHFDSRYRSYSGGSNYGAGVVRTGDGGELGMQFPPNTFSTLIAFQIIVANNGAILFYSGTPAHGNLVMSLSPVAGIDKFGNNYPAGFNAQQGTSQIVINAVAGFIQEQFFTGNAGIIEPASISASQVGAGIIDQLLILSAQNSTHADVVGISLDSNDNAGDSPASLSLFYETSSVKNYVTVSDSGAVISAGSITAVQPGTGTSPANPAVAETWHNLALTANYTPAGAPFATPRYRLESAGGGTVLRFSGAFDVVAGTTGTVIVATLPAAYFPMFGQHAVVAARPTSLVSAPQFINYTTIGQLEIVNNTATGDMIWLDGVTFVLN
jgi:hypothetical protein